MALVTVGLMNKQIAAKLGVSEITVKVHRGNVTRTIGAKSLAELVSMAEILGVRGTKNRSRPIRRYNSPRASG
jgi:FixJ family two-component response regulator